MKLLKKVVIIDDDEDSLFLNQHALIKHRQAIKVAPFSEIKPALTYIKDHADEIDLVFIDLYLKDRVKGTDYVDLVKAFSPYVPIVILTFSEDPADIFQAYKHKIHKYVIKPLTPSKIKQLEAQL
jgi:DNA-binding NtrC family response regulator